MECPTREGGGGIGGGGGGGGEGGKEEEEGKGISIQGNLFKIRIEGEWAGEVLLENLHKIKQQAIHAFNPSCQPALKGTIGKIWKLLYER